MSRWTSSITFAVSAVRMLAVRCVPTGTDAGLEGVHEGRRFGEVEPAVTFTHIPQAVAAGVG